MPDFQEPLTKENALRKFTLYMNKYNLDTSPLRDLWLGKAYEVHSFRKENHLLDSTEEVFS